MRIVVTGLCVTYPFGGVFWDYAQYLLGFLRLGHDVLYLEDTGRRAYHPQRQEFVADGESNARTFARNLARLEPRLAERWFHRDATERTFGMPWPRVREFCRSADLFLQISASTVMRDEYFAATRRAFVDSDPIYTPATRPGFVARTKLELQHMAWTRAHDAFFTFGENVGAPGCRIACEEFDWQPTRQPIVLECFEPLRERLSTRRRVLTTVGSWEPAKWGPTIDGVRCGGKAAEFERMLELPAKSVLPLELALSGAVPTDRLERAGWLLRDAWSVSRDPWVYRRHLAESFGEWSVAKSAYVVGRTGWLSCRTACYLALGVPAVVQDTGFGDRLPIGEGLLAFSSLDQAAESIAALAADPARHAAAAAELARDLFDARKVLPALLERAFRSTRREAS